MLKQALVIEKNMSVEQSFQNIVSHCLDQIQANEAGVVVQHDAECLHQMRVGLRRLRCALNLFESQIELPDNLQKELAWLDAELGAARDWDVLCNSTLPSIIAGIDASLNEKNDYFSALLLAANSRANDLHGLVSGTIKSSRYEQLMQRFRQWVSEREWHSQLKKSRQKILQKKISHFAANSLQQALHRLELRGQYIKNILKKNQKKSAPAALHRIRIAVKKLRYAIAFFQPIYGRKKIQRYLTALAKFQDELGGSNDRAIATRLLKELSDEEVQLTDSIRRIQTCLASATDNKGQKIVFIWEKMTHSKNLFSEKYQKQTTTPFGF